MTRTVSVGGFTFGSPPVIDAQGVRWTLTSIDGWDSPGSGVRRDAQNRPQQHGAFAARGFRTGRSVAFGGLVECPSRAVAAGVKTALAALLADGSDAELTVDDVDEPMMSVTVGLADGPVIDWTSRDVVVCAFELWAPDPLRYGALTSLSTTFPDLVGGLEYDLYTDGAGTDLGYLDYGEASTTGRVLVANPGTADSWPQFEVTGPVGPEGFEIAMVGSDARLVFAGAVPPGSRLVLDSATGGVLLDGNADRAGLLTSRDWAPVPAGGSVEFAFIPRGATSAAALSVSVRPAFW